MLRDWLLAVRIGWLRRRFELVLLVSLVVPAAGLERVGQRLLLTEIALENERRARRRLR